MKTPMAEAMTDSINESLAYIANDILNAALRWAFFLVADLLASLATGLPVERWAAEEAWASP